MSRGVAERVLERVQHSGGRSTLPTRLVVTILSETEQHLTADDLIAEVERRAPGIAPSTVYRVLQRLDELEVLKHVHSGGGAAFYHLRDHDHAHLRCTECGAITDVSESVAAVLRDLEEAASRVHGFSLDAHHSALLGRCEMCSAATSTTRRGIPESVTESAVGTELVVVHRVDKQMNRSVHNRQGGLK